MNENNKDFFGYFVFTGVLIFLLMFSFYHDALVAFIVAVFIYIFLRFTSFCWILVKKILTFFVGGGFIGRRKKD